MEAEDESNMTELEILPDGRICVFGASREVLEIFQAMPMLSQDTIFKRLNQIHISDPHDVSTPLTATKLKMRETPRKNS
ncbi:hypothetical protein [Gimesia sp.]|uniref:hypothetical protein n=1 Tax=Gimesia sp. TaxID=2024833 RepID=UPI000C53F974|nr:hypothetical protein [Gimesia sp.]MAX40105.1 hypothetical protein [Gimesia sp.]HAH44792.1 hypothetical protein [Planctomycetaceae bacterium]HBL44613.1 hypothetical protein [Planctomycetaceae bacterium]|tara:strand:- start:137 stop:373 length:237 start_codon:yes stop_codon:yes gene_type:complete